MLPSYLWVKEGLVNGTLSCIENIKHEEHNARLDQMLRFEKYMHVPHEKRGCVPN